MAGVEIGEVVSFRACSRYLRTGTLVLVSRTDGNTTVSHLSGVCPVHETRDCVETYHAAGHVARWTVRGWVRWRRERRTS